MPNELRDTQTYYLDVDPLAIDQGLADHVFDHGGQQLLDLGCGLGGYAKYLADRGRNVVALDINEQYVQRARGLGVDARLYDGHSIPLPDGSVDTIFMIEVLEHIADPQRLLPELRRVARRNVIITVPNCTQSFTWLTFSHMLDVDHKNFFTRDSLRQLLSGEFDEVQVTEIVPVDDSIAADLLPPWALRGWRLARRYGLLKDRFYFRLVADARMKANGTRSGD